MKKLILFLLAGLSACSSSTKKETEDVTPLKEPPKVEFILKENKLEHGIKSLFGKKVTALFIYNLPDSYLIKAKTFFNPPDYAIQEVVNLQTDRQEWLDQMIVTYCEDCKNIDVEIPIKTFPERELLYWIDKASLNQDPNEKDYAQLKKYFKNADVFWIIMGSENYEQRRGETADGIMISATAENTVTLRSVIYDLKTKSVLNKTSVNVTDRDFIVYEKMMISTGGVSKKPKVLLEKMKDRFWPMPVGMAYDGPKYDEIYPYPPVPESSFVIKKALSALGESLSP